MTYRAKIRIYGWARRKTDYEAGKPWYAILDCELHVLLNDLQYYWDLKWDHKYSKWV